MLVSFVDLCFEGELCLVYFNGDYMMYVVSLFKIVVLFVFVDVLEKGELIEM